MSCHKKYEDPCKKRKKKHCPPPHESHCHGRRKFHHGPFHHGPFGGQHPVDPWQEKH